LHPGHITQVPCNTIHRVSHCSSTENYPRYVLIQISPFNIDFVNAEHFVCSDNIIDMKNKTLDYYIGSYHGHLRQIATEFKQHRSKDLSDAEYADIQTALITVHNNCIS